MSLWQSARHDGLVVSAPARDGGCEFGSCQCRIYITCSLSLWLLRFLLSSLGTYMLDPKMCWKKIHASLDLRIRCWDAELINSIFDIILDIYIWPNTRVIIHKTDHTLIFSYSELLNLRQSSVSVVVQGRRLLQSRMHHKFCLSSPTPTPRFIHLIRFIHRYWAKQKHVRSQILPR